jgi:hypothetical protein
MKTPAAMKRRAKATTRGKRGMEHSGMRWKRNGTKIIIYSSLAPSAETKQKRKKEASGNDCVSENLYRPKINRN